MAVLGDKTMEDYVDIIASGYEWTCLNLDCGALNTEAYYKTTVTCRLCCLEFSTNNPDHANE